MSIDIGELEANYNNISDELKRIAKAIEENLIEIFSEVAHIDRIGCRVKTLKSFLGKACKLDQIGSPKYTSPFNQIQDFIGARVIVYYKGDVTIATEKIKEFYRQIESKVLVPDDTKKFGYEGTHLICSIPNYLYPTTGKFDNLPQFFEMQIKTLFQHAWSQAEHGLGYKPGESLSPDDERKLAFIAAQSWGADTILNEILLSK